MLRLQFNLTGYIISILEKLGFPPNPDGYLIDWTGGIKNTFVNPAHQYDWVLWFFVSLFLILFILSPFWYWLKTPKNIVKRHINDPEKLFHALLKQLDLTCSERKLLCEAARGARLKHPALCLLSPDLLEWTGHLWIQEKGAKQVTEEKIGQLKSIAVKLYDHHAAG